MRAVVAPVLALGCSSTGGASPTLPVESSPAPASSAAPAPVGSASALPVASGDPRDAIAAWREGRREPARREARPFGDVGIAPVVVTRRGRSGVVTLQITAVSDGTSVDARLRAEVRCKDGSEDGSPDFSVGGSIGELDASGNPDFSESGLGGFVLDGKNVPNTPKDVVVAEALAGFAVDRGAVAWLRVGVVSRCGEIDGQNVVIARLPNGTPMLRPVTDGGFARWGAH